MYRGLKVTYDFAFNTLITNKKVDLHLKEIDIA